MRVCSSTGFLGGDDVSLPQAAVVHITDNGVVLGEYCRRSTVAARAIGVLSGTSRSSG